MTASASTISRTVGSIAALGKSGTANRMKPKVPIFSMMDARITEPAVGASTCASGSQVWNGNIGTFTAKARKKAPKSQYAACGEGRAVAMIVSYEKSGTICESPCSTTVCCA